MLRTHFNSLPGFLLIYSPAHSVDRANYSLDLLYGVLLQGIWAAITKGILVQNMTLILTNLLSPLRRLMQQRVELWKRNYETIEITDMKAGH